MKSHLRPRRRAREAAWVGVCLLLSIAGASAGPTEKRAEICSERDQVGVVQRDGGAAQLARGFLAALCSPRAVIAYHGILLWSAAANAAASTDSTGARASPLWQRLAAPENNERAVRVLESFIEDSTAQLGLRLAAIDALADLARHTGQKSAIVRTLSPMLSRSDLDQALVGALLRAVAVGDPTRAASQLISHRALSDDQFLDVVTIAASSNVPFDEAELHAALDRLGQLRGKALRQPSSQRKRIENAYVELARSLASQPPEARERLAPLLIESVRTPRIVETLALEPDEKRRIAVKLLGQAQRADQIAYLLRIFRPFDDHSDEIASALAAAITQIGVEKIASSQSSDQYRSLAALSDWSDERIKRLAAEIAASMETKKQDRAADDDSATDEEAGRKALAALKQSRGDARQTAIRTLLEKLDISDADDIAKAMSTPRETLPQDLATLRSAAEADDAPSELAVNLIGKLSLPETRAEDWDALSRLGQMNQGTDAENAALNVLYGWAGQDEAQQRRIVELLRSLIFAARGTDTEVTAIELLYGSESAVWAGSDLEPLRSVLKVAKEGNVAVKAIEVLSEKASPADHQLLIGLVTRDNQLATFAVKALVKLNERKAGSAIRALLASPRTDAQLTAALEAVAALDIRDAMREIVHVLNAPESEEARERPRTESRAQDSDPAILILRKAVDAVLALAHKTSLSDTEKNEVGQALVALLARETIDNELALKLHTAIGQIGYTPGLARLLDAITRPDPAAESARSKRQIESLAKGLFSLVGEPVPTVLPILRVARRNSFEASRLRAAAHLAGGDDPAAEALIASLGPEAPFQEYLNGLTDARAVVALKAFARAWRVADATTDVKSEPADLKKEITDEKKEISDQKREIADRAQDIARKGCLGTLVPQEGWSPDALLAWLRELVTGARATAMDCMAPTIAEPIRELAADMSKDGIGGADALTRLITPPWMVGVLKEYWPWLLLHPAAWMLLILAYPRSRFVQSFFFWNRWGRVFLGFGYVHLLVTYVAPLRRMLLRQIERDLADVRIEEAEPFFEDIHLVYNGRDLGRAIDVMLGRADTSGAEFARGPLLIEGASGLGKSSLLREYTRRLRSSGKMAVVFLTADECAEGVETAIIRRFKLEIASQDSYVRTLLHIGGLAVVIDGINEVAAETRLKIEEFAARNRSGRIVLATQPWAWRSDKVRRLELEPLRIERVEDYLAVYGRAQQPNAAAPVDYPSEVRNFAQQVHDCADPRQRTLLSRPMLLFIVSNLIWAGRKPKLEGLIEQIVEVAEDHYRELTDADFPRQAFADDILTQLALARERSFKRGDFNFCWVALEQWKLAQATTAKDNNNMAQEYRFTHELILAFYLATALFPPNLSAIAIRLSQNEVVEPKQLRWRDALDDVETFRTPLFYFGDTGTEADVRALAAVWKERWLKTNDRFYREFEIRLANRFGRPLLAVAA